MNLLIHIPLYVRNMNFTAMMVEEKKKSFVCLFFLQITGHDLTLKSVFLVFVN